MTPQNHNGDRRQDGLSDAGGPLDRTTERRFRRILVQLEASREGYRSLQLAASLAASMQTRLSGLFVEDAELLALAELPIAFEVCLTSRQARKLDPQALARDIRAQAAAMQRRLKEVASRLNLEWSFDIARGQALQSIMEAAQSSDLIVLHAPSHRWRGRELGRIIHKITSQTGADILVLEPPLWSPPFEEDPWQQRAGPVIVVDDWEGGAGCARVGARIARDQGVGLMLLLSEGKEIGRICEETRRLHGGLLVLKSENELLQDEANVEHLVASARCPVLLLSGNDQQAG